MTPTEIVLPADVQHLADLLVEAAEAHAEVTEHPALDELGEWLDDNVDAMNDVVCDQANWVHAPYLDNVVERVRDNFDGDYDAEAAFREVAAVLERALDGDDWYWGDEYRVPICGTLRHSDGRTCVLRLSLEDYLCGPYNWDGVYRDMQELLDALSNEGRIVRASQLMDRREEVATLWGPEAIAGASEGTAERSSSSTTRVTVVGYLDPEGTPCTVEVRGWECVLEQFVETGIEFSFLQGQMYVERPYSDSRQAPRDLTVVDLRRDRDSARMVQEFAGHARSEEEVRIAVANRLGAEVLEWKIVGTHMVKRA